MQIVLYAVALVLASATDTEHAGESLTAPSELVSKSGNVKLEIQTDGNLVVMEGGTVVWASNTGGHSAGHLDFQTDGNLVLYDPSSNVVWATNTSTGNHLTMQDDCNLVMYADQASTVVAWATNTAKTPTPAPGPAPPGPAPGPAPGPGPTPPPGPLPPLPDKTWFGWWGGTEDSYDSTSLFLDSPQFEDDAHIDQIGGPSMRFLYPAYLFFCQEQAMTGKCTLFSDYQNRWNAAVPKMHQYLADQKILGFMVGDERICGDDHHGTSVDDWNTIINTMRNSFPKGQAIIYTNECGSTWGISFDTKNTTTSLSSSGGPKLPDGLDWIGFDKYYTKDESDFFKNIVKPQYESTIFPMLASHQKVAITPQATKCDKLDDDELNDAKFAVDWASKESRIAYIDAYRFDEFHDKCPKSDLMDFWVKYGKSTK